MVQRVSSACVVVDGAEWSRVGPGLLVFLGVGREDTAADAAFLADRVAKIRIFEDAEGKRMSRSVLDTKGEALVSQFTLYADVRRGRRPDFLGAMAPAEAEVLYEAFQRDLAGAGVPVRSGRFGAHMAVESTNDGPVTLLLESPRAEAPCVT